MARILVIHCTESGRLPKLTEEQKKGLVDQVTKALAVSEEGIGICDWEASPRSVSL